jgi:hypothetical protein
MPQANPSSAESGFAADTGADTPVTPADSATQVTQRVKVKVLAHVSSKIYECEESDSSNPRLRATTEQLHATSSASITRPTQASTLAAGVDSPRTTSTATTSTDNYFEKPTNTFTTEAETSVLSFIMATSTSSNPHIDDQDKMQLKHLSSSTQLSSKVDSEHRHSSSTASSSVFADGAGKTPAIAMRTQP